MAKKTQAEIAKEIKAERIIEIRTQAQSSLPGQWSNALPVAPSCVCGLRDQSKTSSGAQFNPGPIRCYRHA